MTALIEELFQICRSIRATGGAGRWRSCGGAFRSRGTTWLRERRFNWVHQVRWNMTTRFIRDYVGYQYLERATFLTIVSIQFFQGT